MRMGRSPQMRYMKAWWHKQLPKTEAQSRRGNMWNTSVSGWRMATRWCISTWAPTFPPPIKIAASLPKSWAMFARLIAATSPTGMGLLVIEAAERIAQGMDGRQIQQEVNALRPYAHASFVLDTLEFLHAGGRCSSVAMLGANLLKLKPCIMVDPARNGAMGVGKKYRGTLDKALVQYTPAISSALAERI